MESETNLVKIDLVQQDVNLERSRKRFKKLTLIFKLFFITLSLIIGALIIYLVQDFASESDQSKSHNPADQINFDPTDISRSPAFDPSLLQKAADELEDAASFILHNYFGSNTDSSTDLALKKCWRLLQNGSNRIRVALLEDPFRDDDRHRVEMMNRVMLEAEKDVRSCLDDLEKVESTAGDEVRVRLLRAKLYLSGGGGGGGAWRKLLSAVAAAWSIVSENVFAVCLCGLQFLFILYLLRAVLKFR